MPEQPLHYCTIAEAAAQLRSGAVTSMQLTQACLKRIRDLDGRINSFITVTEDVALAQARQADEAFRAGRDAGPLQGIPIALKDLYDTQGIRTTAHSRVLEERVPEVDATVVTLLRQAGTVLLGKLAMHEFAFGTPGFDTPFPPARNPWNPEHVTGGSSSGSGAALAAGLCYGALGSDTGGSIRSPAALCGIAGIKPTYGRVSRAGVLPLSWSLDHAGPMARSVGDCALLLQAIAGHDARDPASADVPVPAFTASLGRGVEGRTIGVPRDWLDEGVGTDAEVVAAFDVALDVLRSLGAEVVTVDAAPFIDARHANTLILIAEAYAYHEETLRTRHRDLSKGMRTRVLEAAFMNSADYVQAQRARSVLAARIGSLLREVDFIASPSAPQPAEPFDKQDPEARYKMPSFTSPFNLSGLPAISVPCGFSAAGLPIGLQLAGRPFEEPAVLSAAHAFEAATDWHQRHPAL
jgi:aspartyl-tRNA(Asn)/glutamyl-tRNA(Gln) amidotransferase subunit A